MVKVAVIGGGVSGVTAAYKLLQEGKEVLLFEPNPLGGFISSLHQEGFILECGPNILVGKPDLLRLIEDLQLQSMVRFPVIEPYKQHIWCKGKVEELPKTPWKFLFTSLLSFPEKLKVLAAMNAPLKCVEDDETIESFFSRHFGSSVVTRIMDPALKGIYGGQVSYLSIRSVFPGIWEHARKGGSFLAYMKEKKREGKPKIFTFANGIVALVHSLGEQISAATRIISRVVSITSQNPQFSIKTENGDCYKCDEVVIATPPHVTAGLVGELSQELATSLQNIPVAPLVVVHASVSKNERLPERSFGILFPRLSSSELLGVMFNSQLFPHVAPANKSLLTVCLGGIGGEGILTRSDVEVGELVKKELRSRLQIHNPKLLSITKWQKAIPQFGVGHFRTVGLLRKVEEEYPGLSFVGTENGGIGVPDRVKDGLTFQRGDRQ